MSVIVPAIILIIGVLVLVLLGFYGPFKPEVVDLGDLALYDDTYRLDRLEARDVERSNRVRMLTRLTIASLVVLVASASVGLAWTCT